MKVQVAATTRICFSLITIVTDLFDENLEIEDGEWRMEDGELKEVISGRVSSE